MGNILDCRAIARAHRERITAELAAFQKSEVEKWARVIKEGNIKLE